MSPQFHRAALTRGLRILRDHLFTPMGDIRTALQNGRILLQPDDEWIPVTITWNVPCLDSQLFPTLVGDSGAIELAHLVPFTLPPLQDAWPASRSLDDVDVSYLIDEFHLSFDQRSEAMAVTDTTYTEDVGGVAVPYVAHLDSLGIGAYDIRIALTEKRQSLAAPYTPEQEVWSLNVPATNFSGWAYRNNPMVLTEIGARLRAFRTYAWHISVPGLFEDAPDIRTRHAFCLPSFTIVLKLRVRPCARDTASTTQNSPTIHLQGKTPMVVTGWNPPAINAILDADSITGADTHAQIFDDILGDKLQAGVTKDAGVPPREHLQNDAGYEIIALPLWGNFDVTRMVDAGLCTPPAVCPYPYVSADADEPTCAQIPLPVGYPLVIHHVYVATGIENPPDGIWPANDTYLQRVGVSILSGKRGDLRTEEQVAYASWTPATKAAITIDRLKERPNGMLSNATWDWELLTIPLVGAGGTGYNAQGRPYYVGKASGRNAARTNVGVIGGGTRAPLTRGNEQDLLVKWELGDIDGLDVGGGAASANETYTGYGGNWIYIVCKRSTIGPDTDLPVK